MFFVPVVCVFSVSVLSAVCLLCLARKKSMAEERTVTAVTVGAGDSEEERASLERVWGVCLRFLEAEELGRLRRVCRFLAALVKEDEALWKAVARTRREDLVYHDCIAHPDNDQGITEFEYYGKTVEEKAKEAPVRAERDPMGHRGALHDPYAAAAGAGEE